MKSFMKVFFVVGGLMLIAVGALSLIGNIGLIFLSAGDLGAGPMTAGFAVAFIFVALGAVAIQRGLKGSGTATTGEALPSSKLAL